jgi:hypothetical protein
MANSQVTPLRVAEAVTDETVLLELVGIAVHLEDGDTIQLRVHSSDPQYAHNGGRLPDMVTVELSRAWLPIIA